MTCCYTQLLAIGAFSLGFAYWVFIYIRRLSRRCFLPGKVVLVTGATSGIGEALAYEFLSRGCSLIVSGRSEEKLETLKRNLIEFAASHPNKKNPSITPEQRVRTLLLDMESASSAHIAAVARSALEISPTGRVDVLVNNAGISFRGAILDVDVTKEPNVHETLMRVNHLSHVALTTELLRATRERLSEGPLAEAAARERFHAWVVGISSVQGRLATPFRAPYCASKHALEAFHHSLRMELASGPFRVHVLAVQPGYVLTSVSRNALRSDGSLHGKTDDTHERGYTAEQTARAIADALAAGRSELTYAILLHRLAVTMRAIFPEIIFWQLEKLARKSSWVK